MYPQSLITVVLLSLQIVTALPAANITAQLHKQLSPGAKIFLPSDINYTAEVTPRWTVYDGPTYKAVIEPATENDVQTIVKVASANNIEFMATGGGHGYTTTYVAMKDGISIQMGPNFAKEPVVNATANTITICGGTRFNQTFDPLYNAGKEIQVGSGTCVGMVGATLGAGVGRYQGLHGLIIDALLSVRIVVASGDLVTASTTENSDLFWAIRGAGANFGIITYATYKIEDLTNEGQVLNADMRFPVSKNQSVWEVLKTLNDNFPAPASVFSIMNYDPNFGGANIIVNAVYAGPEATGLALYQPFFDLKPMVQNVSVVPWNVLGKTSLFGLDAEFCVDGGNHNLYALGIKTFDIPTFVAYTNNLTQLWETSPVTQPSSFEIELFPTQAVKAVPDNATAYPYRDIQAQVMFTYDYPTNISNYTAVDTTVNNLARTARSAFNKTSGFPSLQVYTSYGHGDEGIDVLYAARKLVRLLPLKKKWDPENVFRFNNPLVAGN